mmetsp:Transcript_45784/g.128828  ORF Transcript_45784/g.128828 Transcript_45784/m.128828 type:complete len:260 (+) Transcript_45784:777-1556(+)
MRHALGQQHHDLPGLGAEELVQRSVEQDPGRPCAGCHHHRRRLGGVGDRLPSEEPEGVGQVGRRDRRGRHGDLPEAGPRVEGHRQRILPGGHLQRLGARPVHAGRLHPGALRVRHHRRALRLRGLPHRGRPGRRQDLLPRDGAVHLEVGRRPGAGGGGPGGEGVADPGRGGRAVPRRAVHLPGQVCECLLDPGEVSARQARSAGAAVLGARVLCPQLLASPLVVACVRALLVALLFHEAHADCRLAGRSTARSQGRQSM